MPTKHQIDLAWTAIDRLRRVSHHINGEGGYGAPQPSGPTESSKAWFELTPEQLTRAMDRHVPWDGFSGEEKAHVVQNVIADTSEFKQMDGKKWMEGIVPALSDYDRMLDEAASRMLPSKDPDRGMDR